MGEVLPLPHRGDVFLDPRGEGRSLRVSGHRDAATVVLSIWRQGECRATFRLSGGEVDEFIRALLNAAPPAAPSVQLPVGLPTAVGEAPASSVFQVQISGNVVVELNNAAADVVAAVSAPDAQPATTPADTAPAPEVRATEVPATPQPAPAEELDGAATTGDVLASLTGLVAVPDVNTAAESSPDPAEPGVAQGPAPDPAAPAGPSGSDAGSPAPGHDTPRAAHPGDDSTGDDAPGRRPGTDGGG